ncbi:MAG TPA: chromate efflux transporter [Methylomirabilota bacterium]|nr:chromate efflux transporter [Methylomirabilota bacterium]
MTPRAPLGALVRLFLRLGVSGFGGPLVHISMMETEAVERRKWLSKEEFLDGLGLCQMLPGPASTQLGVLICYLQRGLVGGLIGGLAFVLPGFCVILALTLLYARYGAIPAFQGIFFGIAPAVIAVIGFSAWRLGRTACSSIGLGLVATGSFFLTTLGEVDTVLVLILCGAVWVAYRVFTVHLATSRAWALPVLAVVVGPDVYARLAWLWMKMGALVYGGGYVIIPVVRSEAVERWHWLSDRVFLDGLALSQLTPGPIVNLSVFVGYQAGGLMGSVVAAVGVFAPAFAIVLAAAPLMERLKRWTRFRIFLQGVNAAVVGAIVAATIPLARSAIHSPFTGVVAVASLLALWRFKLDTVWLILAAGAAGWLWSLHG